MELCLCVRVQQTLPADESDNQIQNVGHLTRHCFKMSESQRIGKKKKNPAESVPDEKKLKSHDN